MDDHSFSHVPSRSRRGERGQIVPFLALGMVALMGMLALSVDLGYWRYEQRLEQSAADNAAVAGAIRLNYPIGASTANFDAVAKDSTATNGFMDDNGAGNLTVTTTNTPPTPPRPGATAYPANSAVQVTITKKQNYFFGGIFGGTAPTVSAHAVAVAVADYSACLYQLETAAQSGELTFKGNKPIETVNCGVVANGPVNSGFGSTTTGLNWYGDTAPVTGYTGPINHIAQPATDPCFKIPGCAWLQNNPIPPSTNAADLKTSATYNVPNGQPYAVVKNCCPANTTLGPGLYYMYGGVSGTVIGTGVTIVNVDGSFTATGLGAGAPYFSAPQTGNTAGVAYYQPPQNTNGITLNGGGNNTSMWDGTFYAPTALFLSNGGSTTFSFIVTGAIRENGGGSNLGILVDPTLGSRIPPSGPSFPTKVVIDQ